MASAEGSGAQGAPEASRAGVLELREVTKRYVKGARPAVDRLSLTVPAGEVCVLIGPSGCGKTTALKMINRLIEPTSGEILIDGRSVRDRNPAHLRREIGYVIQQVGLLPHLTVAANIATVPKLLGWDKARIAARVRELLELIGLDPDEFTKRYPAQLSGGQQQRVGLARALAADPHLMLMDEPFSAVDPITRERLQNDFLRLHRAVPKTVIFVSHDIDEAVKMADRVAIMREGHLVQYAPPAELLSEPADEFVADFVGADRALKGLGLTRVEEISLLPAPIARVGETVRGARERLESEGLLDSVQGAVLLADAEGRPLDWVRLENLGDGVIPTPERPNVEPVIDHLTTLRDALSALFESQALFGVVVDETGRIAGLVSVTSIAGVLRGPVEAGVSSG
jgi:osmoprotectant transport system ATP-binding protein